MFPDADIRQLPIQKHQDPSSIKLGKIQFTLFFEEMAYGHESSRSLEQVAVDVSLLEPVRHTLIANYYPTTNPRLSLSFNLNPQKKALEGKTLRFELKVYPRKQNEVIEVEENENQPVFRVPDYDVMQPLPSPPDSDFLEREIDFSKSHYFQINGLPQVGHTRTIERQVKVLFKSTGQETTLCGMSVINLQNLEKLRKR